MTVSVAPTEDQVSDALVGFLVGTATRPGAMRAPAVAIRGQVNRVPSPSTQDYAVFWPLRRRRLGTNLNILADAKFDGSITGSLMTITAVSRGALKVGSALFGTGLPAGLAVLSFGTGTGATGTYNLNQVLPTPTPDMVISAGVQNIVQQTEFAIQIDVHGPNSGDNAQRISTLLRDDFGVMAFAATNPNVIPLHADDPKQIPFVDDQNQYEDRYVIEATVEISATVLDVPQEFMDQAVVNLIDVDAFYPP